MPCNSVPVYTKHIYHPGRQNLLPVIVVLHAVQKLVNASEHCSPRILSATILHCCRSHALPCDSMQPVYTTSYLLSCTRCSLAVASPADLCNLYFRRVQARSSHAITYSFNLLTSQFVFAEFQLRLCLSQVKPQPHPLAYILNPTL